MSALFRINEFPRQLDGYIKKCKTCKIFINNAHVIHKWKNFIYFLLTGWRQLQELQWVTRLERIIKNKFLEISSEGLHFLL